MGRCYCIKFVDVIKLLTLCLFIWDGVFNEAEKDLLLDNNLFLKEKDAG